MLIGIIKIDACVTQNTALGGVFLWTAPVSIR
jgi:hypothetical protein